MISGPILNINPSLAELLAQQDIRGNLFDPNEAKKSKQKRYFTLMRGVNILSYSTDEVLQVCERKFSCKKLELNVEFDTQINTLNTNVDFAYGRAVESGVQSIFLGRNKQETFFNMFTAWDVPLMAENFKQTKSFTKAVIAIDQLFYIKDTIFAGWEVAMFNGKPAVELSMCVDLENGYYYVGHADIILWNPVLGRYKVLEIKTTGVNVVDDALYKNSNQALGYSIILDSIAKDAEASATYEVFYLVFPVTKGFWELKEFTKSSSHRAEWINGLLFDFQRIELSRKTGIWPKRGSSCFDFYRRCDYFDRCDLDPTSFNGTGEYAVIGEDEIAKHEFDFRFKLSDMMKLQEELI